MCVCVCVCDRQRQMKMTDMSALHIGTDCEVK